MNEVARIAGPALVLLAACAVLGRGQSVRTSGGRVIYREASANERTVTASGLDTMPALSPDGRLIVFVRRTPGDSVDTALGDDERTELWVVGTDGARARRLLRGRADTDPKRTLAGFVGPTFSPDGRTIYLESAGWVTSGGLHAVDVATGSDRFVCPSNGFVMLEHGRHRGQLLVWQHRYNATRAYDGVWIVSPTGRTIVRVTLEDAQDADARIAAALAGRAPSPARSRRPSSR